jgi:pimeloyl-ACP methyl ester carboxylesterase
MMPVHPEGPRYRAPLVFVPGLWTGPEIWRRAAGLFAHRGWEGWLVDLACVAGGTAARADALIRATAALEGPPVLIAQDAGGVVALEVARRMPVAAVVWVRPMLPGGQGVRAAVSPWRVLAGLLFGTPVRRPAQWMGDATVAGWALDRDAAALVVDVVRGRTSMKGAGVPTVLVAAEDDRVCPPAERTALAATLGAEVFVLPVAGRFPLATGPWQRHAGAVHRWLVTRLGETLLEFYDEAMAERDAGDEER